MIVIKEHIAGILNCDIKSIQPISGGDISSAYKVITTKGNYFLKTNRDRLALDMFRAEKIGLEAIEQSNTIKTPAVIELGTVENHSFLLLEFIESKHPTESELIRFGEQLAMLHNIEQSVFGFSSNNYIGSLHQSNQEHTSWTDFYYKERLLPQFKLGMDLRLLKSSDIPSKNIVTTRLNELFKKVTPSLIHGDLWSGNYLIAEDGEPYLIDPAVYYGHSEVDIAMSKLFGGFGQGFYDGYYNLRDHDPVSEQRTNLYQLYYLLVHLNIFGSSYYSGVKSILKRYF